MEPLKMYFLLKMGKLHCYVSLPECNPFLFFQSTAPRRQSTCKSKIRNDATFWRPRFDIQPFGKGKPFWVSKKSIREIHKRFRRKQVVMLFIEDIIIKKRHLEKHVCAIYYIPIVNGFKPSATKRLVTLDHESLSPTRSEHETSVKLLSRYFINGPGRLF